MAIIQGMSGDLPIYVYNEDGSDIDMENVVEIEFCVGTLRKLYKNDGSGDVTYVVGDDTTRPPTRPVFLFPLTEGETFDMTDTIQYQFRVRLTNDKVLPSIPESIEVIRSSEAAKRFFE